MKLTRIYLIEFIINIPLSFNEIKTYYNFYCNAVSGCFGDTYRAKSYKKKNVTVGKGSGYICIFFQEGLPL